MGTLVVALLLKRDDVNPNHADTEYGRTPLLWAVHLWYPGVVELLLKRKDINPNIADSRCGGTPLWWAAQLGHVAIVKSLLERKDLNPDIRGPTGQTALEVAASWKHERVVEILSQSKLSHPLPRNPASKPSERYRGSRGLSWLACCAWL